MMRGVRTNVRIVSSSVRSARALMARVMSAQPAFAGRLPQRGGEGLLSSLSSLGLATGTNATVATQVRHLSSSAPLCASKHDLQAVEKRQKDREEGRALTDLVKVEKLVHAMKVVRGKLATAGAKSVDDVAVTRPLFRSDPRRLAEEAFQNYVKSALGKRSRSRYDLNPRATETLVPLCAIHGAGGTGKSTLLSFTLGWFAKRFPTSKTLSITLDGHDKSPDYCDYTHNARVAHRLLHAAINANACPTATIAMLRSELQRLYPEERDLFHKDDWFTDRTILAPALRMALDMGDDDHLLLTVDVVGRPDEENLPVNDKYQLRASLSDLWYIRLLSQTSFHLRTGEGVVLFVSAAVSAADLNRTTSDSRIPLFLLPLPPVDPEPFFERACIKLDLGVEQHERRALVRRVLGDAAFNARCLETTYCLITGEQPTTITADFEAAKKVAVAGDLESIDASVGACMRLRVDKFLAWSKSADDVHLFYLFRALFWPRKERAYGHLDGGIGDGCLEKLRAEMGGDALGVCAIVRDTYTRITEEPPKYDTEFERVRDTIFMHPRVCAMLCEALRKSIERIQTGLSTCERKRQVAEGSEARISTPTPNRAAANEEKKISILNNDETAHLKHKINLFSVGCILRGTKNLSASQPRCRYSPADHLAKLVREAVKASGIESEAASAKIPGSIWQKFFL